jgi:hypothetical protein
MATSQERVESCRIASLSATGPRSAAGKEASCRNSMTHGLSGSGRVVPEGDSAEVERRASAYVRDLDVRTDLGRDLARQMAIMAVRMDRAADHESLAIAHNRRHAVDRHDDARQAEADRLFEALGEDPRAGLRQLRRMPEGVDRLIGAWEGLRAELTRKPQPRWNVWHRERAENLTGHRSDHHPYTEIGDLSEEIWGPARGPLEDDDRAEEAARANGRARMIERIDAEIAALEAHLETLDHATLERDRQEAPGRAAFDDSKAACLARRYEAEASRRFFKLLAQLKQAEAEAAERPPAAATPAPATTSAPYGSFRVPPRQEPVAPLGGWGGPASPADLEETGKDGAFAMTADGGPGDIRP